MFRASDSFLSQNNQIRERGHMDQQETHEKILNDLDDLNDAESTNDTQKLVDTLSDRYDVPRNVVRKLIAEWSAGKGGV